MPCFKPQTAYKSRFKNDNGVYDIKFYRFNDSAEIQFPCGKCIGCQRRRQVEWSERGYLESKNWENNYFLTFTYNEENEFKIINSKTNILEVLPTEYQKFLKRLRKYYWQHYRHRPIRFIASGEYGEKSGRPHFHLVLYNLPIFDLEFWGYINGSNLSTSKIINKIWGNGHVLIGEVNTKSIGYVVGYTTKKVFNKDKEKFRKKEFFTMSRRPGIGYYYFEKHKKDLYKNDKVMIHTKTGYYSRNNFRYFDNLYKKENEGKLELVKEQRVKDAKEQHIKMLKDKGITYEQWLKEEFIKHNDLLKKSKKKKI